MLDRMTHRGPDGEGVWDRGTWVLGHRRLAIVDLSEAGQQPMQSKDGRLVCAVNGEIYNYAALRTELETTGAIFHSQSDSEVVLHAFRAWGRDSFLRFNGMFAFALVDTAEQRLYLVRDRLGIKPLYYTEQHDTVIFASEIKALIAGSPESSWTIDPAGLGQYLTFQNLFGGRSLFSPVSSVRPGHYLEVGPDGAREQAYHTITFDQSKPDLAFDDAVVQFRFTLKAAVGRHLMSDVPVTSYLSAGFDSTMVASQATQLLASPPHTFTGHFNGGGKQGGWYDEVTGARLVAGQMGAPHHEVPIDAAAFAACFDDVVLALDEPRMGIGSVPQYLVAKAAAQHGKVILTGHGGDELFSGYPVFKMALFADLFAADGMAGLAALKAVSRSEVPHLAYFALQALRRKAGYGRSGGSFLPVLFSEHIQQTALQPVVWHAVQAHQPAAALAAITDAARTPYERIMLTYLRAFLPGLLVVEDKISMAHALESRTPLLDNEMVDLSLRLPPQLKLHQGQLKAVIKAAARDTLPPDLLRMPKRGFPTPLSAWLRGPLAGWMRDRLCEPEGPLTRIFRHEFLEQQTAAYLTSWTRVWRPLDEVPTHRMWMLLNLESWLRQHETRYGITLNVA